MALGLLTSNRADAGQLFRDEVESIEGQELIAKAFPGGASAPTDIVVPDGRRRRRGRAARRGRRGRGGGAARPARGADRACCSTPSSSRDPYSTEAYDLIPRAARGGQARPAAGALVGGPTAVEHDLREAAARDTRLIVPIALVIVFLILIVLLRALVAPLLLIATVVLSFAAALGVGAVVFDVVFGFPGVRPVAPAVRVHLPGRAGRRLQHLPDGPGAGGDARATARARACCAAWRSPAA